MSICLLCIPSRKAARELTGLHFKQKYTKVEKVQENKKRTRDLFTQFTAHETTSNKSRRQSSQNSHTKKKKTNAFVRYSSWKRCQISSATREANSPRKRPGWTWTGKKSCASFDADDYIKLKTKWNQTRRKGSYASFEGSILWLDYNTGRETRRRLLNRARISSYFRKSVWAKWWNNQTVSRWSSSRTRREICTFGSKRKGKRM